MSNTSISDSILLSIKKLLGLPSDVTDFDLDILTHINAAFMELRQLGVGTSDVFEITGETEAWSDFIDESDKNFNPVKTFVYDFVKLAFDPPTSSAHVDVLNRAIERLEWRLNVEAETDFSEVNQNEQ